MELHEKKIDTSCNLPSHTVDVLDSDMHFFEIGEGGDPILFVHGMPTHAYLWRNILPQVQQHGRCIALDLIGMGASGKPDIDYTIMDHIRYFEAFIDVLDLNNITLVMHGWGSLVALDYASRHPEKIKALAFFESHIRPMTDWDMLSLPVQQLSSLLNHPGKSYKAIVEDNYLIKKLLKSGVMRTLSSEEMMRYEAPYKTLADRKPLWQYVQEIPLGGNKTPAFKLIEDYSKWLASTKLPKLMLYAVPGFITTIETVQWAKNNLTNLTLIEIENALHFAQESEPELFSQALSNWLLSLK